MDYLRYWSFPVANGKAAVLINTRSNTSLSLVDLAALPHLLSQLECARSFCEPLVFEEAAPPRRAARKGGRKKIT